MSADPNQLGTLLIIGGAGMLGTAWRRLAEREGVAFHAPSLEEFDLTTEAPAEAIASGRFSAVVNCAAWTDVDGAEDHEEQATEINGGAVARLATACAEEKVPLVHYSTDYVFQGDASEPYATDHARDPLNAYGRSKAVGEEAIEASGCHHLTIRTSWLYAPWGKNFVLTMRSLCRSRDELKVVDDQRGRPTSAEHLAEASLALLRADAAATGQHGLFHVSDGGEPCTWHGFASAINEIAAESRCTVHPCTTDEFPRPALRPAYSVMDLDKTESAIGPRPAWRDLLADTLGRVQD
ncbi:MAG: dTDP-4-dehydrorhamnose reductase [Planctomycetota bacterium]